ncbi:hypothetical protein TNCT_28541 [Trichonephila clavata]|uniref:Uncharacterized protein n=1 Tax=Trichonephila clavata TaxID=2740835 RepID=A0A8X6GSR5_TRICU|nr:hypothetical protein TNCT_28541 [Trichonephila clavata]
MRNYHSYLLLLCWYSPDSQNILPSEDRKEKYLIHSSVIWGNMRLLKMKYESTEKNKTPWFNFSNLFMILVSSSHECLSSHLTLSRLNVQKPGWSRHSTAIFRYTAPDSHR